MLRIISANIFENKEGIVTITICTYFHLLLWAASINDLSLIFGSNDFPIPRPTSLHRSFYKLDPSSLFRPLHKCYPLAIGAEDYSRFHIKKYSWLNLRPWFQIFNNKAKLFFRSNQVDHKSYDILCLIVDKFWEIVVQSIVLDLFKILGHSLIQIVLF